MVMPWEMDWVGPTAPVQQAPTSSGQSPWEMNWATPEEPKIEKPFGITDTWPFRLGRGMYESAKDAATLPGDVYTGKQSLEELSPGRTINFATLASPGVGVIAKGAPSPINAPAAEELKAAGAAGYDAARASNVALRGDVVGARARAVQADLKRKGFYDTQNNAPSTFAILKELETGGKQGASLTAGDYINLRQAFQKHAQGFNNGQDSAAATYALKEFDKLFDTTDSSYFVAGTPAEIRGVRNAIKDARENFAASYRSNQITGKEHEAELRSAAANSGKNYDNTLRQRLAGVALSRKQSSGYTPEEIAKIEGIAEGSPARNFTRDLSNYMGGGGGLGSAVYAIPGVGMSLQSGDLTGALLGLGIPLAGRALKKTENALTKREVNKLDNAIRSRSPMAIQQAAEAQAKKLGRQPPPFGSQEAYRLFLLYQMQNPKEA